jgi:hypothetical protein
VEREADDEIWRPVTPPLGLLWAVAVMVASLLC